MAKVKRRPRPGGGAAWFHSNSRTWAEEGAEQEENRRAWPSVASGHRMPFGGRFADGGPG